MVTVALKHRRFLLRMASRFFRQSSPPRRRPPISRNLEATPAPSRLIWVSCNTSAIANVCNPN